MKRNILVIFITALSMVLISCSDAEKFEKEDYISFQSENLKVEAEIFIPAAAENGTAPCGKGTAHSFSSQIELLNEKVVGKREFLREEMGSLEYRDGYSLTMEPGGVYFMGQLGDDVASCLQLDKGTAFYSGDLFKQHNDLSFKPYLEAYREVSDCFRELGVEVAKEYSCYAMDYENMILINQKFAADGDQTARTVWTPEEECYYFLFRYSFQGIPIVSEDDTFMASSIGDNVKAMYGQNGIEWMLLSNCYDILETESVSLISASKALETIRDKYRELLINEPVEVNKIELCLYADVKMLETEAKIYPVWSFLVAETPGEAERKVLVDAQTGKEIIPFQ